MKVRCIKKRGWRGGVLVEGDEYNLPDNAARMLIDEGSAVEVVETFETASVGGPNETGTAPPLKPRSKATKRNGNSGKNNRQNKRNNRG